MGGDADKRLQGLMELQLPEWIETAGWPKDMAARVRPEAVVPEPEPAPAPAAKEEPAEKPSALAEAAAPEIKAVGDDMLAKVMAKAKEKGVDLADIGLKPASEVQAPSKEDLVEEGRKLASDREDLIAQGVDPAALEVPVAPIEDVDEVRSCPNCGEELIDGECWTCM